MKFQSLVILVFVGMLAFFFEARKEIGEEVELLAYNLKSRFHSHRPSEKIIAVELPEEFDKYPDSILTSIEKATKKNPLLAVIIVQANELSLTPPKAQKLFSLLAENENFGLGFIGTISDEPLFKLAPRNIIHQLRSAPTARVYNKDTITGIPTIDDTSGQVRETLVPWLGLKSLPEPAANRIRAVIEAQTNEHHHENTRYELGYRDTPNTLPIMKINYFSPEYITPLTFNDFLLGPNQEDKIVFFYSPKFRPRIPGGSEATFANTPWHKKDLRADLDQTGVHVAILQAIALDNLITGKELKKVPEFLSFLILVIACIFAFFIWEYSPDNAVAITLGIAGLAILLYSQLESFLGIDIPVARTFVYGCLCSIAGAFHATSKSVAAKAKAKIDSESEAELSRVHESFLDSFSMKLLKDTAGIMQLANKLKKNLGEKAADQLHQLIGSCSELKEYLQSINQFAAIRNGSAGLPSKKVVPVKPMIEKIISQLEPQKKNIRIETNLTGNSYLITDPLYLDPILFNLISNAVKYSPEDSQIEIISEEKNYHIRSLTVRDQGPGISEELREKVFEKFYRIKDDRAFTVKGSGLGLYLSRFFSEALQLSIHVAKAPYGGCDFVITRRGL